VGRFVKKKKKKKKTVWFCFDGASGIPTISPLKKEKNCKAKKNLEIPKPNFSNLLQKTNLDGSPEPT
jgi:hypothetical protein